MKITGEMHFAKALAGLKQGGVDMQDLTPAELYALAGAARRCADPFSAVNAELAGNPVQVGRGVWLWPLTIGAQVWLDEHAWKWWKAESRMGILALAYAMRHAREPDAFTGLTDRWQAAEKVLRSALTLPVRIEELCAAICRVNWGPETQGATPPPSKRERRQEAQAQKDFASIVARLEAVSGIPRSTWLWERSLMYTFKAYAQLHAFAAAASRKGGGGRMFDELDGAMSHLAEVKAAIVRRLRGAEALGTEAEGARYKNQDGGAARG